ncbi:hypothetical protein ABZ894_08910 [Nocardia beijingensis]|uniref:dCTP deaminase n=1 Tax=Nocardia beijingensis TaxID=95162 RepID=UPI0033EEF34E
MVLTGRKIIDAVRKGEIVIDPFDEAAVNPNSYNYRLGPTLRTLESTVVDARGKTEYAEHPIPDEGLVLQPGRVYLGTTVEVIGSDRYVPSLIGRSSMGRLGVFLQISADLGNLGVVHHWTLEIVVCQPVRLYAGMTVGQVSFWMPTGDQTTTYEGYFGSYSEAVLPRPGQLN